MSTKAVTILAVDDRPDNLFVLEQLILDSLHDVHVVSAGSATEGIELARNRRLDAALIDVQMPGMSGIEMVRRLKSDPGTSDFPILLLTAHESSPELRAEGLNAGADDFLSKPVDNVELVARIRAMLRIKRAEDRLRQLNLHLEELVEKRSRQLRSSEERLHQAQKMEAIGQLAGGIAHDFNNLLTAILGNAQLLELRTASDSEQADLAGQIVQASRRAAELTNQLLAFARKSKSGNEEIDLHKVIEEVLVLTRRTTDRKIELREDLQADETTILGDTSQFHNAILNLTINACDAMDDGGTLSITTRNYLDEPATLLSGESIPVGTYIELLIHDTGVGMDEDVLSHLFEPFFTTKEPGKGTGLGLAGVWGCINNAHGYIDVKSRPEEGTTFQILLPIIDAGESPVEEPSTVGGAVKGRGHVLLVDDEKLVRDFAEHTLKHLGYTVSTCEDGIEAVEYYREHADEIDLVLLDVIMPRMSGKEAYREIRKLDPDVAVVFSSGYSTPHPVDDAEYHDRPELIHKPYQIREFSEVIARNLPHGQPERA